MRGYAPLTAEKITRKRTHQTNSCHRSLNAQAFSVSIINVTAAAENCRYSVEEIKAFADVKTTTSWESMAGSQGSRRKRRQQLVSPPEEPKRAVVDPSRDLRLDPATLDKMLRGACDALVQAEPDLTKCKS